MRPDRLVAMLLMAVLGACAGPAERYQRAAEREGLALRIVEGEGFAHAVFERARSNPGRRLHVYLEGDGTPYLRALPAADPTPRRPLALALMARDPGPAVLLGRPCYHGLGDCLPALWTTDRYGQTVLASLEAALARLMAERGAEELVLIGHSGGGTLAMLLAERLPETVAVVTIAANLDVAGWARHHGLAPLTGSLDPARTPPLTPGIVELHFAGARDSVVPPPLIAHALEARGAAPPEVVDGFDHVCCWEALWPEILERLDQRLRAVETGSACSRDPILPNMGSDPQPRTAIARERPAVTPAIVTRTRAEGRRE